MVKKVLKTNIAFLVDLHMLNNLTCSAMASALGGFNAHASNTISAVFLATNLNTTTLLAMRVDESQPI